MNIKNFLVPEDFSRLREPETPKVSPSGDAVLYAVQYFDSQGTRRRQVILGDKTGKKTELPLNGDPHHPVWSSDGSEFAYVTGPDGQGHSTVHIQRRDLLNDETYSIAGDIDTLEFSPESDRLVVGFLAFASLQSGPRVVTHLRYHYNGRGFLGEMTWQVVLIDRKTGDITDVSHPHFHHFSPTWSPDGTMLAMVTTRHHDWDLEWVWDVYTLHVLTETWNKVTHSDGVALYPSWSPSGEAMAFLHNHSRFTGSTQDYHLCEATKVGGGYQVSCLSHRLDRGAALVHEPPEPLGGGPRYSSSGDTLYWVINDQGQYVTLATGRDGNSRVVARHRGWPSLSSEDAVWAELVFRPDGPPDVALRDFLHSSDLVVWKENAFLGEKNLCRQPELYQYQSGGRSVEAWLWTRGSAESRVPLLVHFHGGPHGSFGPYFSMTQQILASAGYCVAALNYRGSAGFGQDFANLVHANWGPQEGEDGIALIEALGAEGRIDEEKVGVFGPSYGGFMTQWMITHYPEKIHRAVAISTVSHLITSAYGIDHWESLAGDQGGRPDERPQYYSDHSPVAQAARIDTPLLLLHGEEDRTCPLIEAEMMFVALRWQKKPVEWVRYPGESHSFHRTGRLDTLIDVHQRILAWFAALT